MKLFFDLFPVILFFLTFKGMGYHPELASEWANRMFGATPPDLAPILIATLVVIVATLAQIAWVFFRRGHVSRILWVSLVLVVVLGGLTLALRDATFIKWKPTVLNWVMAASMTTAMLFRKNAIRLILKNQLELPEPVWLRLNCFWIGFFVVMGGLNLYVAFSFPTATWVDFKTFVSPGLTFVFAIAQGFYLSRYIGEAENDTQA